MKYNNSEKQYISSMSAGFADTVQAIIRRSCMIDYGIVEDVPDKGIVTVALSVANSPKDIKIITCVLACIASSDFAMNISPVKGDKVLVVYPRRYSEEMFDPEKDIIIDKYASGYNLFSGIAILMNQYKPDFHHNFIDFTEGTVTLRLAYSEDDDDNLLVLTTNPDGSFSLNSNNNTATLSADGTLHVGVSYDSDNSKEKVTLVVDNEGAVTVNSNDKYSFNVDKDGAVTLKSNTVTLSIDKDGNITIAGKAEAKIDKSGNVTLDAKSGKLSLKNSSASLYTILNGMLQTLNTSLATAGSPASHTVVPQQFATQSQQLEQLMQ